MKRFDRYKRIKIAIALIPLIIIGFILWRYTLPEGMPADPFYLNAEHMPEGTYYIDILAEKEKIGDDYVDFTAPPFYINDSHEIVYLDITPESGIAKYDAGGYVSLMLHRRNSETEIISAGREMHQDMKFYSREYHTYKDSVDGEYFDVLVNADEIYKKYGKFRIAFVDRSGNIIGVTENNKIGYTLDGIGSFDIDGENAVYTAYNLPFPFDIIKVLLILAVPFESVLLIILVVFGSVETAVRSRKQFD